MKGWLIAAVAVLVWVGGASASLPGVFGPPASWPTKEDGSPQMVEESFAYRYCQALGGWQMEEDPETGELTKRTPPPSPLRPLPWSFTRNLFAAPDGSDLVLGPIELACYNPEVVTPPLKRPMRAVDGKVWAPLGPAEMDALCWVTFHERLDPIEGVGELVELNHLLWANLGLWRCVPGPELPEDQIPGPPARGGKPLPLVIPPGGKLI